MASIIKEFALHADAARVWDALQDFGALHTRLVPGFVMETKLDGNVRTVTFANGTVAKEYLVSTDYAARRLVYGIAPNERVRHYSASASVSADGAASRFIWTVDVLPNELAPYISAQMDAGVAAMRNAFGG
ncbi:MAG TPA: SRPBCC family protein [Rhizomicrobium sp.]|nr:SRPBCC family protein [Rhizomicrobium sp.]